MKAPTQTDLPRKPILLMTTAAERSEVQRRTNRVLARIQQNESKESALRKARESLAYLNRKLDRST